MLETAFQAFLVCAVAGWFIFVILIANIVAHGLANYKD